MSENINDIIARAGHGETVILPSGEFEGPVYITKPIKLMGSNTTLWARRGSVIEITCGGAMLQNIRAELTESDSAESVIVAHEGAAVDNVEIFGGVSGFGEEDGYFDFPRSVYLGEFAAEGKNTFVLKVSVPVDCAIECNTAGLCFTPDRLSAGENLVTVTAQGFAAGMLLYAEVLLKSQFTRRFYVSGRPIANAAAADGTVLYQCGERAQQSDVFSVLSNAPTQQLPAADIRKGQRISLYQYVGGKCEIRFTHGSSTLVEVDPYLFLLDTEGKAFGSTGMVFFGCESSDDGAVRYFADDGHIEIDFDNIDYRVDRIVLVYSVYPESIMKTFERVKSPCCVISADGADRITYSMYGLSDNATAIALEFYNYKGEWKVTATGRGYGGSMAQLCEGFGIVAE